jgi:segregation and condensation protein A
VSVASRMQQLTMALIERSRFDFEELFLERSWASEQELRSMLIVTLMSVLELVRLGVARVHQPEGSESILVERAATEDEARSALAGYDEHASFGPTNGATPSPAAEPSVGEPSVGEPSVAEPSVGESASIDPERGDTEASDG